MSVSPGMRNFDGTYSQLRSLSEDRELSTMPGVASRLDPVMEMGGGRGEYSSDGSAQQSEWHLHVSLCACIAFVHAL